MTRDFGSRHARQRALYGSDLLDPGGRLRADPPQPRLGPRLPVRRTSLGRTMEILHVTDEFTRESLCDLVAYSIDADRSVMNTTRDAGSPDWRSPFQVEATK